MQGWASCKLGDVITLQRGFDLPSRVRRDGPVPVVSSSGVTGCHDSARVRGPGVVTGRYGTLGEVFYIRQDFWPLNTTLYVRDFKGNDPLYISYFLRTLSLSERNGASAVPGLDRNVLHLLPVTIPPLPTQRKIAAVLSAYDNLIENNTRRIALLEQMTQALYREWFVEFQFPGHQDARPIAGQDSCLPVGWTMLKIGNVASYINRGVAPKYADDSESIVINQKCIRAGRLSLDEARTHSTRVPPEKKVRFGDVLVNSTGIGTLGRVAQVYQDIPDCSVDTHVTIVRPSEVVDVDYFGLTLLSKQAIFDHLGIGSTGQTELGRGTIADVDFLMPPLPIQCRFGELVSPMRRTGVVLASTNSCLRVTRNQLLPQLISGEVDVCALDIEVPEP